MHIIYAKLQAQINRFFDKSSWDFTREEMASLHAAGVGGAKEDPNADYLDTEQDRTDANATSLGEQVAKGESDGEVTVELNGEEGVDFHAGVEIEHDQDKLLVRMRCNAGSLTAPYLNPSLLYALLCHF